MKIFLSVLIVLSGLYTQAVKAADPTIQQQLAVANYVHPAPGTYSTNNGPIIVEKDKILNLTDVTIVGSGTLVVLAGSHSTIIGGKLVPAAGTTDPIIKVVDSFRFKINGTNIQANVDQMATGVQVLSTDPKNNKMSYYGSIENIEINSVDVGILLSEQANGIHIGNPLVSAAKTSYFRLVGAYGNQVIGGFSNGGGRSGETAIVFDLQSTPTSIAQMNFFAAHVAEPGKKGRGYVIGKGCFDNHLDCIFNTKGVSVDQGTKTEFGAKK